MKKTYNINLGGYPFVIDDDAYEQMDQYLKAIQRHFSKWDGCEEIMVDIEGRMAELFNDELKSQPIISQKHLDAVIDILGRPEQFGAESMSTEEEYRQGKAKHHKEQKRKEGKRLFRDLENKRVAGVCSGLAAYLGVEDPLVIRLITVIFAFASGISIPVYLIMWAVVPAARTASDRLAMRGEPINIDSIGRIIEYEIDSFSNTINEIKDEFTSKKK